MLTKSKLWAAGHPDFSYFLFKMIGRLMVDENVVNLLVSNVKMNSGDSCAEKFIDLHFFFIAHSL